MRGPMLPFPKVNSHAMGNICKGGGTSMHLPFEQTDPDPDPDPDPDQTRPEVGCHGAHTALVREASQEASRGLSQLVAGRHGSRRSFLRPTLHSLMAGPWLGEPTDVGVIYTPSTPRHGVGWYAQNHDCGIALARAHHYHTYGLVSLPFT